jgi:hypothetical protein
MKCEECGKELGKEVWAFQTTKDAITMKEHDFCSENCGNIYAQKLKKQGFIETGTNES